MFNVENLVINKPVRGTLFNKSTGEVIFSANQFSDASLECSGEQVYVNDALGQKIASFDRSKDAVFSASNALINFGMMAAQFGSDKEIASDTNKILVPAFDLLEVDEEATSVTLSATPASDIKFIYSTLSDKSKDLSYAVGTTASATEFAIQDKVITLPTGQFSAGDYVAIWYEVETTEAVQIKNTTTNFAKSGRFVLEVLCCDICDQETEYYTYIIFNNAKVDNNVTIEFSNEATHALSVTALQDYCSAENELFTIVVAA